MSKAATNDCGVRCDDPAKLGVRRLGDRGTAYQDFR